MTLGVRAGFSLQSFCLEKTKRISITILNAKKIKKEGNKKGRKQKKSQALILKI